VAAGLKLIDWSAPWLAPVRDIGQRLAQQVCSDFPSHDALNSLGAAPVRFVDHAELPPGQAYEHYIFNSKQCPTRGDLHDFLNGVCWIHFPRTKNRLNQLQAAEIDKAGVGQVRGPVRDALTLFDENTALLRAPDVLWNALANKDWHTLFVTQRPLWQQASLVLFGHALMEKLVSPRKAITAHVYRMHPASDSLQDIDAWVTDDLSARKLAGKPFAHLPVLGVPGWWPANEDPGFYTDSDVFRPLRAAVSLGK
jgi:hypothetical protein